MGPKVLNGRAKYLTTGNEYGIEYRGEGTAKKAGHHPPKMFDFWENVKDEDGDDTGEIEDVQAHIDETDDGEPPF